MYTYRMHELPCMTTAFIGASPNSGNAKNNSGREHGITVGNKKIEISLAKFFN